MTGPAFGWLTTVSFDVALPAVATIALLPSFRFFTSATIDPVAPGRSTLLMSVPFSVRRTADAWTPDGGVTVTSTSPPLTNSGLGFETTRSCRPCAAVGHGSARTIVRAISEDRRMVILLFCRVRDFAGSATPWLQRASRDPAYARGAGPAERPCQAKRRPASTIAPWAGPPERPCRAQGRPYSTMPP